MLTLSTAALLAAGFIVLLLRLFHHRRSLRQLQGPQRLYSLLGHEVHMSRQDEVGDLEFKWLRQFGPTWRIQGAFGADVLMTGDPKALQHIFHKSGHRYAKTVSQNHMNYLLGGPNIVWAAGADHQRHRKVMNPAFSAPQLRSFLPLFQRITGKLTEKWKRDLAGSSELETAVNEWFSRTTLDIIGQAGFDYDYRALDENEESALAKAYHGVLARFSNSKDAEFRLPKATMLFRATWTYLPQSVLQMFQYIPADPFARLLNLRKVFSRYGQQMLSEKRPEIDTVEKDSRGKDIMSVLIKANASSDAKTRLDDDELMAEMFTLTLAGHETTATTLTFLLYELARNPEYQNRMREEVQQTRARVIARGDTNFTMEDLDSMTLCMNAIKDDVLPLSIPVVSTSGETITEIPIKKGQGFVTSFAAYHRLREVWGDNPDIWNPDRFFHIDVEKQINVGVFANLMTFSAGVRGCIGWRFSIIEMQAVVAAIVEQFQFRLPAGAAVSDPKKSQIQRAPAGGAMVPLTRGQPELGPNLRLRVSLVQAE
ncbi:PAH-inducible cytochrome P450 monooxygenase PC-PAH 4 [Trametes versicolor FP-101664 SS1]|uniref:PAH-inducible cytochrome P450 monooxygenase PC-PAH 4 n=1 Tax=Trametes versicolor (strain FP-101664) TaxID=717944 RepID=UPI00046244E7|nr:PAH-inducible cytochrome P450 monooxygenase PC-PAH 4 [Trametes versicolor FP-101664 SS1]EIW62974.1 PAH-inducible cytochrome P450 monooxygenase PC-PAH 4 [Trametes versicolor FP-101664 SS1]